MTETLVRLLTRLSESGPPALLWGRVAKPHFGARFDRLLAAGVLVEQAPDEIWSTCTNCECAFGCRPIVKIDGRYVAACPIDAGADTVLEPDDLRSFLIYAGRLVASLGALDADATIGEPIPGLWSLGSTPRGRSIFVTLDRTVVADPALLSVMRTRAPGAGIALDAPPPPGDVLRRLQDAGDVHVLAVVDAVTMDDVGRLCLDPAVCDPPDRAGPRLVLYIAAQTVLVDGTPQAVPSQPFRLLNLLVECARRGGTAVENRAIFDATGREGRDLVRELRDALSAGRAHPGEIRGWIEARRSIGGFALVLPPDRIDVRQ